MSEQGQQVIEKYLFIITPMEIKSNSKIRSNNRKSILINLGNKTAKCTALGTSLELEIDVIYSKTLQKYCPLKGIIKIYDVAEDGTQIISCVGGFQTDQLLNESKTKVTLEKEIGTSKLTMDITIINRGQQRRQEDRNGSLSKGIREDSRKKEVLQGLRRSSPQKNGLLKSSGLSISNSNSSSQLQGINSLRRMLNNQTNRIDAPSPGRLGVRQLDYESIEASRNYVELQQSKKELAILKKLALEKDKKIVSLQKQIEGAELTIRNLRQTNKHLAEDNHYLQQKQEKSELALYHKEASLKNLHNQIEKMTLQLQQLDNKLQNSSLVIEELKEEVSNCSEIIDKYREKYGDLKNVKNRAIEMEIKECLRWIQLQNRDMDMSEIEDTVPSEHSEDRGDSLSSVIRNIEIQKVPKEEMSIIRHQLVKILQRVDEMMGK